jgi:preprotein translocase subunit SecE
MVSKKLGKTTVTETHAEPEPEASGARGFDAPPPKAPPGSTRFGAAGAGGSHRERGLVVSTGPFARMGQFIRDVRAEMRRVSWPSAKEVKNTTIITLVAVIFFATYLFVVDQGLSRLINGITWLANKVFGLA